MRRSCLAVVCALVASATPARAWIPEDTPDRGLAAAALRMTEQAPARGARAAVLVMRGGRVVWSMNGSRPVLPASLMKLATTTAAMLRFGPDHRFPTRVLAPRKGATVDRLWLVGGGDPTFASETYRRMRFEPKPFDRIRRPAFPNGSPTVGLLAGRVARAGIRRVRGDLVADESLFDTQRTQPGWLPRYLTNDPDTGLLSALSLNEGRGDVEGKTLLPSQALGAGEALKRSLERRGIRIDGRVVIGRAPRGSTEIARVESPTVAEIIDFVNRYSINFEAEMLLKGLGARFGGAGSTRAGVDIVLDTLADLKVPLEGFVMADGSGLSLDNRITAETIAHLVERIRTGRGRAWNALRATIPVAGQPGSLERRMLRPPTGGNLRGKTGLLRSVRAMAGWVTAADGVALVYVAMFNGARSAAALTAPLDLFGFLLASFPFG